MHFVYEWRKKWRFAPCNPAVAGTTVLSLRNRGAQPCTRLREKTTQGGRPILSAHLNVETARSE
eukprot:COSAG06_NODE_24478_length_661_cov_1.268683_2_plen_63_part_01